MENLFLTSFNCFFFIKCLKMKSVTLKEQNRSSCCNRVCLILQIRIQNRYVWNKRESSEVGTPLTEVMEFVSIKIYYYSADFYSE